MISKTEKKWMAQISELDEFFGREPKYPLTSVQEHISYELHKTNEIHKKLSYNQIEELKNSTLQVCGSIEEGFTELFEVNKTGFENITNAIQSGNDLLSTGINTINRNLEQIDATLHWGFSALINQLTITNSKLDQIIQLLNIPDSQKQRKFHIEEGFHNMKKSSLNPYFFTKAKEHFEKAIEINDDDYLSLQQLGIIHMYSKDELNLELSSNYLKKSIIFSESEIQFSRNVEKPSSFQFSYNPSKITATTLTHLARNYFINENYQSAYENALKATKIYRLVSSYYDLSIYASNMKNEKASIAFLNEAIKMDRYIVLKALTEENLADKKYILDYLKNLNFRTAKIAEENLKELESIMHHNSIYKKQIDKIRTLINKKTYLNSLKSLEFMGYELDN